MSTSIARPAAAAADVHCEPFVLEITLADGREIPAPMEWFPRLRDATPDERAHRRLIGRGEGVRWQDIGEDASVSALLGAPA
jgi:Protein of unknown function (DUF2442)